uniref:Uncharacterized protein n=1 Tax=Ananas comosus var. bracteatus TaxID=296719 RepID=A0A6V7P4K5_ANACO|nr:unnamed protein product [Ananas comosus var. bracteatus]
MAINLESVFNLSQLGHPLLKVSRMGNIVFISSIAGVVVITNISIYLATKHTSSNSKQNLAIVQVEASCGAAMAPSATAMKKDWNPILLELGIELLDLKPSATCSLFRSLVMSPSNMPTTSLTMSHMHSISLSKQWCP